MEAVIAQLVQSWATDWTIGVLRFDSRGGGLGIFLFTTASRTALGPTQPPIQRVPGALSLGVKRPGREADHSPPSSAEVKNALRYTSTPPYVFMAWCLVKHRDNFTFTFIGEEMFLLLYIVINTELQLLQNKKMLAKCVAPTGAQMNMLYVCRKDSFLLL
jgi:hypothetical protein